MDMIRMKIFFIIITVLLVTGCLRNSKAANDGGDTTSRGVELNLEVPQENEPEPVPFEEPVLNERAVESNRDIYFFISGRTELLSIKSEITISAEDFTIGKLYDDYTATVEEQLIVDTCRSFFESVNLKNTDYDFVDPQWVVEIRDYVDFFLKGKILFERVVFAKPEITGNRAEFGIRIFPENLPAYVYLLKNDGKNWLISGLEVDVWKKSEENQEKWFPSINPSPFGY